MFGIEFNVDGIHVDNKSITNRNQTKQTMFLSKIRCGNGVTPNVETRITLEKTAIAQQKKTSLFNHLELHKDIKEML